jgi:hypothetical protein
MKSWSLEIAQHFSLDESPAAEEGMVEKGEIIAFVE